MIQFPSSASFPIYHRPPPPPPPRFRVICAASNSTKPDYYKVLKVAQNASLHEIKSSYRALARKVSYLLLHFYINRLIDSLSVKHTIAIYISRLRLLVDSR